MLLRRTAFTPAAREQRRHREPMTENAYLGDELKIFAHAVNWKQYYGCCDQGLVRAKECWRSEPGSGRQPAISARGSIRSGCASSRTLSSATRFALRRASGQLPGFCSVYNGTTEALQGRNLHFDTILYIDVLEHIKDDCAELQRAASLLNDQGRVIVLAPAHNFLFSPFDGTDRPLQAL